MDVGLTNENYFTEEILKDVVFLVEASTADMHNLWKEWSLSYANLQLLKVPENFNDYNKRKLPPIFIEMYETLTKHNEELLKNRVEWEENSRGVYIIIGYLSERPIGITFFTAMINDKKVAFYHCESQLCDHQMIDDFLLKNFQRTHDNYTRWNHVNADNFHNCVNSLEDIDIAPRKIENKPI